MTWQREFEVYAAKGPVDILATQRRVARAFWAIRERLTADEITALATARSHALHGEGREEFDLTIAAARARLTQLPPLPRR